METKQITSKKIWEDFLLKSNQPSFLQSWYWGEFHQSLDHKIFRLGFYKDQKLIGLALIIKIKAKRGTYLECPAGPVIPWSKNHLAFFKKTITKLAKQEKALFLRLRSNILADPQNTSILQQLGFIKSPMHLHAQTTLLLDLNKSEEDLLANMKKNTRYDIKKAQKLGVKVTTSTNPKDIDTLYQLQLETVTRKNFVPFSKTYLKNQLAIFKPDNKIQLFKASYKGQVLAISFIIFYGQEAVYHYSGSSNQHRNIPASYALQWQAIKKAKALGFKHYNFWGYTNNPKHRFFGPSLFKKGFGGYQVDYMPAHDLPLSFWYWPIYLFETFRRKLRRL
ncbi:lipid II:glycine glycyltransferase FemX [Patescibacteria group bacterium]